MKLSMVGRLSQCLLLAYRTPAESVRLLLPAGLELVTRGPWAFWNVVVCRVEKMRLAGLPRWCGISYHHAAYRLYVKSRAADGQDLQGLYFLRSDADSLAVSWGGNRMTDFHFNRARFCVSDHDDIRDVGVTRTRGGAGNAMLRVRSTDAFELAGDSCFSDVEDARATLKYQPLGLSVSENARWVRIAEVFRDEAQWRESPVVVEAARWTFFEGMGQDELKLELATKVAPIDYRWRLGRRSLLASPEGAEGVRGST